MSPRLGLIPGIYSKDEIRRVSNTEENDDSFMNGDSNELTFAQHNIISRRNVKSLTYLQEEDLNPSYERNEDDAFISISSLNNNNPFEKVKKSYT